MNRKLLKKGRFNLIDIDEEIQSDNVFHLFDETKISKSFQ